MEEVVMKTNPPIVALLILESWEVPLDLTVVGQVCSAHNSWNMWANPKVWFAGSTSKFSASLPLKGKLRASVLVQTFRRARDENLT